MIYALRRKIDFVKNLRALGVKIWTEIFIRVKNLTFSMSEEKEERERGKRKRKEKEERKRGKR